jgi:mannosyltransferase OCH1-like enzyme
MRKRSRRKPLLPLLLLLFLTSSFFLILLRYSRVYTLISLLFEDGARDLVDERELRGFRKGTAGQKIPRIIHQTYANESVTGSWETAQMTCLALHEGWEYMVSGWNWGGILQMVRMAFGWRSFPNVVLSTTQ